MLIRQSSVDDAAKILKLQKLAYQSEAAIYNDYAIPPLTQTLEAMEDDFESKTFLVAEVDGRVIGSVRGFVEEETCYIARLIVHPDFQNQVIGTKLLNEIEKVFSDARRFELFTGHRSEKNLYLYQKLGYRIFRSEDITENLTLVYLEKT